MSAGDRDQRTAEKASRLRRFAQWFAPRYMDADLRTLGLWRIVIGTFLCIDGFRHAQEARFYYSNEGLFQNHWLLFSPTAEFNVSLFTAFSTPTAVRIAFACAILCFFFFAIGFKTRAFNLLSLIWYVSIDQRLLLRENGGYIVVVLLTFWTLFLPMGERFSVDAWRRAWRATRGAKPEAAAEHRRAWPRGLHRSLASAIVVINFALIYLFNVVNKFGSTWMKGHTVHYVLHIDRMVTPLAVWSRQLIPFWVTMAISWTVLVVEAVIMLGILWPENRRYTRPLAILLLVPLHGSFGTMMRLGPFSWAMITFSVALLCPVHWASLGRVFRRRVGTAELRYRGPFGATAARVLALLDHHDRLLIAEGEGSGPPLELERDGARLEGRAAWWAALGATPAGRFAMLPRLLSLGLLDVVVASAFSRPEAWARFFGWSRPRRSTVSLPSFEPTWFARRGRQLRELVLVLLILGETSQLINENKAFPKPMKHKQPHALRAVIGYPRIFQGWGMFAPNPIRVDGRVGIDAITIDGRHIDPLRIIGGLSPEPDLDISDDEGSGYNQIHQDYQNRIRLNQNEHHRTALRRLLDAWHERTGNPADEIVQYDVFWVHDRNPLPGMTEPFDAKTRCLLSWRKPGVRKVAGELLPPRCRPEKELDDKKKDKKDPADGLPKPIGDMVRWWRGD